MNHSPELGNVILDPNSSILLRRGRLAVARLCEIDASSINSLSLAERLQGISRAISDVILEQTVTETSDDILRHFDDPTTRRGRMFVAHPNRGHGASLGVYTVENGRIRTRYNVRVPADRHIDRLLMQEPALWDTMVIHADDLRSGRRVTTYPFNNRFYQQDTPSRYLRTLQELSVELLSVTEGVSSLVSEVSERPE